MIAPVGDAEGAAAEKARLRARVTAARRATDPAVRAHAAARVTRSVLDLPDILAARCVAAYFSFGTEPSTAELLAELGSRAERPRLLLPVLRDDLDLDWAIYDEPGRITQGARGLWVPDSPNLGVDAVAEADVVVVPALAVGPDGARLGRGGGSYDRALSRVGSGTVVALLYDGELLSDVPAEAHDRPVDVAVLPSGVHRLRPAPAGGRP
jgi:5-formyltetrahydrofolate cyclo-ligase